MPNLKSLKIKTNLLAITGKECMTSTGAFVEIKMLILFTKSAIECVQHMHIQIANRLYYYTGNKAFPQITHSHPNLTAPHCRSPNNPTFRITKITNRRRTCEIIVCDGFVENITVNCRSHVAIQHCSRRDNSPNTHTHKNT